MILSDNLYDVQMQIEQQALDEGKERYERQQKSREENQGYGSRTDVSKLIKGALPILSEHISTYLKTASNKGKGKTATGLSFIQEIDPDLLASVTLTHVFSVLRKDPTLTKALTAVGRGVENELWGKALEAYDNKLFDRLLKKATKTHGSLAYRRKAVRSTAQKEGFLSEKWTSDVLVKVGEPLVNCLLQALPEVFTILNVSRGNDTTQRWIALTPEARQYLSEISESEAWMHPVFKPMVVPPRPWTDTNSGGYYSGALGAASQLIRTYDKEHLRLIRKAIKSGAMAPCLEALNAIQNTAWAINKPIFEIVRWCWDEKKVFGKFPRSEYINRTARPDDWDELSPERQKAWKIQAAQVAERNRAIDGERVTVRQDFAVAEQFSQYERFYIPHSLDFRGRVYPIPHFNQQRQDHVKAMLQFAEGKPLGESGAYWLAVHLANCGDFAKVSKKSFDDRVAWVHDNVEMIERIANDPRGTFELWSRADKPLQYLAACLDFAGFLREGHSHVSHLAVALDGSNSGLQHYSAALRSEEGRYVNLLPSAVPADIYQAVADIVKEVVEKEAAAGDELAKLVLANGIDRKLVKRNVMTFAYSSEQFGMKKQLQTDVMQPLALEVLSGEREFHPYDVEGDNGFRAAGYLASRTFKAVTKLISDASEGMKFFQRCAAALAHEKKGVLWHTPIGLPCLHKYLEMESKAVKLFLYDKTVPVTDAGKEDIVQGDDVLKQVRLNIQCKPTSRINKTKARNAVAPNVIHSMDASHLLLTVLDGVDAGIRSFSLIHDSFATHCADTEQWFGIIRSAFVNMYQNYCPFEEIHAYTQEALEDKSRCPDLPQKGSVDLSKVMESDYAFA